MKLFAWVFCMYLLILLNVTFYFLFKKKSLLEKLLQIINIDKRKFWTICLVREAYLVVAPTALNNTRLCSALPKISPISSFRAFSNLYPISKPNNQLCPQWASHLLSLRPAPLGLLPTNWTSSGSALFSTQLDCHTPAKPRYCLLLWDWPLG